MPTASCQGPICSLTHRQARTIASSSWRWCSDPSSLTFSPSYRPTISGTSRAWPWNAALDSSPEALAKAPAPVTPEVSPHYWRAIGYLSGRYWYDTEQSLSPLNTRVQAFVPRLDPSVRRSFLQGVGQ